MKLPSRQANTLPKRKSIEALVSANSRASHRRFALEKLRGLQWSDSFRGHLTVGAQQADVRLEPNDLIRVRLATSGQEPASALAVNRDLPGNVRFARDGVALELLADTQVDGESHLTESFRQIRYGFRSALGDSHARSPSSVSRKGLHRQQVCEVLQQLKWSEDSIVEQDESWELRPRVAGESFPIRLEQVKDGAELWMGRTVLESLPRHPTALCTAFSDQALRFNHLLRLVRLSIRDDTLVCEARLHAGLLHPRWLAVSAQAIAVACHHVHLPLRILAEQEQVASNYLSVFFPSRDSATSGDVVR